MTKPIAGLIERGARLSDLYMYALNISSKKSWGETCTTFTFFVGSKARIHRHLSWCTASNWHTLLDEIPEEWMQEDWYFYSPKRKTKNFF